MTTISRSRRPAADAGGVHIVASQMRKSYSGFEVLRGVSFDIPGGERFGVIGPNGAGKSVLLNALSGVDRAHSGLVCFDGVDVRTWTPNRLATLGLSRTFQLVEYFKEFTAADYITLSWLDAEAGGMWRSCLRTARARREITEQTARAIDQLDQFGLGELASTRLGELPYGVQKMVDVVRAVAARPRLLLLDEPTTGTGPAEREQMRRMLAAPALKDTTVVLVDHDVSFVAATCTRVMAINFGAVIATDSHDAIFANDAVVRSYLGQPVSMEAWS